MSGEDASGGARISLRARARKACAMASGAQSARRMTRFVRPGDTFCHPPNTSRGVNPKEKLKLNDKFFARQQGIYLAQWVVAESIEIA